MSNQRRDYGEAPPKFPDKPMEEAKLPPDYGTAKKQEPKPRQL